ncbi:MAG TPA: hypothetical protein EYQ24_10670 [Bacteroidetes bacterium]|nr:hypothetical protein [Bacteroidota bacterium]HIL57494.1 hypothetical protein [Rhodothermales bacterium]
MLIVGRKQQKPRGFYYEPRFHDPKEEERKKRRIRIERPAGSLYRKTKQPQFIAVGLGLVLALYLYVNADAVFGGAVEGLTSLFGS